MTGLRNATLFSLLCTTILLGTACGSPPAGHQGNDGGTHADGGTKSPTVTISAPSNGASVASGASITFTGSATDSTGKAITGNALAWTSNKDGKLGLGASITNALTTVGQQTITLTATDSAGHSGSASINLTVTAANAPIVKITSPPAGTQVSIGQTITFSATVKAPAGATVSNANIVWKSSIDGQIGIGPTVATGLATAGTHTITCTATDSNGHSGSATVSVIVANHVAPTVKILSPADGSYFKPTTTINFRGTATASAGNTLKANGVKWTDQYQQIGLGTMVRTALTQVGDHTVTFSAADTTGAVGQATITVHIVTNLPPVCTITAPNPGQTFLVGSPVTFTGTCTDPDSNQAPTNLTWSTDVDGTIGHGTTVTTQLGSTAGDRVVSLCANDPVDPTIIGCSTLTIHYVANTAPSCAIIAPLDASTVQVGNRTLLNGTVTDNEDPRLTGIQPKAAWTDDKGNKLGALAKLYTTFTTAQAGTRTLTLTGTDSGGLTCSASVTVLVNQQPTVKITSMMQGTNATPPFNTTNPVDFAGTGNDPDGDPLTYTWTDSFSGVLGSGTSASLTNPTAGHHTVSFVADDGNGGTGIATKTFLVAPAGGGNLVQPYATANTTVNNPNVPCVTSDSASLVSFGLGNNSVWQFLGTSTTSPASTAFANALDNVLSVYIDEADGMAFVGTRGHGYWACKYTTGSGIVPGSCTGPYNGSTPSDNMYAFAVVYDANGNPVLVVGTRRGLFIPNSFNGSARGTVYLRDHDIRGLAVDGNTVWVATNGDGLYHFDPLSGTTLGNWRQADGAPSNNLFAVAVGYQAAAIWVGSDSGLGRFQTGSSTWTTWQQGGAPVPGLVGTNVNAVAIDRTTINGTARDVIWCGTGSGVSRFDPTIPSFMNLTTADGLPSNQVNGITVLPSGTKVFATGRGLARYTGQ